MSRRVLIVAPSFYPHPQVGSVRPTNWARMLPDHGWEPHVAVRHAGQQLTAEAMAQAAHPEVVVHALVGHSQLESSETWRRGRPTGIRRLIPSELFVPDVGVVFWRRARDRLLGLARELDPDVVVTTGPPHSVHMIGMALSDAGFPWLADYRDPALLDDRYRPKGLFTPLLAAHKRFEQKVYCRADVVTHAIESHYRWARRRYAEQRCRMTYLPHFCPSDLATGAVEPVRSDGERRSVGSVGHVGEMEAIALASAIRTLVDQGHDLELRLAGRTPDCANSLRDILGDRLVLDDRVPHDRARAIIAGADVLVAALARPRSQRVGISSKLYEYIAARRPIVAINPTRPDRRLLRRTPMAHVLEAPTVAQVSSALSDALHHSGRSEPHAYRALLVSFSADAHAATLAALLDDAVASVDHAGHTPNGATR